MNIPCAEPECRFPALVIDENGDVVVISHHHQKRHRTRIHWQTLLHLRRLAMKQQENCQPIDKIPNIA